LEPLEAMSDTAAPLALAVAATNLASNDMLNFVAHVTEWPER
jgi:hypothetical protein